MRDSEVVASIVAGDPAGLAVAYDRYAGALLSYCRSMLHEPADAADVVHDTFVIAAVSLHQLRDPQLLRPWLYAVARNLALRKLRAGKAALPYPPPETAGVPAGADAGGDVGSGAERAELRALLRAAAGGLNRREREVIELRVWQGLDTAEAAAALGISRAYAYSLLNRARTHLVESVGVLVVARTGRGDCAVLDGLLRGWDGQLTAALRKRLRRHIERCEACSGRRRRDLRPTLLSLWPTGALAAVVRAEQARHAAAVPAGLKDGILQAAAAQRAGAASARGGLRKDGFPQRAARARTVATCAAAGAAAAVLAIVLFGRAHQGVLYLGPPGGGRSAHPPGAAPPASPGGAPGRGGPGGAGPTPGVTVIPVAASSGGVPPASAPPSASPSSVPPSVPSPSSSPSSPPASPSPAASSASPSATQTPQSGQGTLAVSPATVVLTPLLGSTLTLTARNGPVSWSIAEPASLLGKLIVAPSSGTLAAGQSALVSISVSGLASLDTTLTVSPGGQHVTVLLGVALAGG